MSNSKFKFQTGDRIGAAAAEDDEFLSGCFVDTGSLALLEDLSDRRVILLGRTGSGKSALLCQLEERNPGRCIWVSPEKLALSYVSNSTIIKFFGALEVNLDPFFKLLWRHVLVVEILNKFFETQLDRKKQSLLDRLSARFNGESRQDKEMREGIEYLEQWGENFWLDTDFRVKGITKKMELELEGQFQTQLGTSFTKLSASALASLKLSEEQKSELRKRGQEIVSKAQVQDLAKVLQILDSVLEDRQKPYYLLIDKLDENWVEEGLRYKLIMALIDTARAFNQIDNAKVILALRRDLIDRVFQLTRGAGFQEEKFQSLYLPLSWTGEDLIEILDKRIDMLVKRRYTKKPVTHQDLLPCKVGGTSITTYLVERVSRPRDLITFFNECIAAATTQSRLKLKELSFAEGNYSRSRLNALADEWTADYPSLLDFTKLLEKRPSSFKLQSIQDSVVEELCLQISVENPVGCGMIQQRAMEVVNNLLSAHDFKLWLMKMFYKISLVGLKPISFEGISWAGESGRGISAAELDEGVSVTVHQMYHRALGIKP